MGARIDELLRSDPEAAGAFARAAAGADPRATLVIVGALGTAGTPQAQHGLVELAANRSLSTDARVQSTVAMSSVEHPDRELTDTLAHALASETGELQTVSGLALGVTAARLAFEEASRADAIVVELLARLNATADPAQEIAILRALGNAGDARALPSLQALIARATGEVRRVAVEAIRSIPGPEVDGLLGALLLADRESSIRTTAAYAVKFRDVAPLQEALSRALAADRDANVRLEIVHSLGTHRGDASAVSLLQQATRDADPDVRAVAAHILEEP
jgi:HEAT repeat protein